MSRAGAKKAAAQERKASPALAGLVQEKFEEESWRACVCLVVGGSPEEEKELIKPLVEAVQKPLRKCFTLLSMDNTLAKIHELGHPNAKKPDNQPMFYEITEPAKMLLNAGEEIPCELMAKILKFQLLQIKASDQHRREAEQIQLHPEDHKEKVAFPSDSKAKGSNKREKGSASALKTSSEKKTQLKRRDYVEPPTFIDDEPEFGPQHYILLVGFYQPQLILMLDAIGVHVANVIKLCCEQMQTSVEQQEHPSYGENEQNPRSSSDLDAEIPVKAMKVDQFWSDLRPVLDSGSPHSLLHDVAQLSYTVPDLTLPLQTQDPMAVLDLGSRIFGGVANLIYDCLDWYRQYQHYCNSVKLISVPSVGLDLQTTQAVPTVLQTPRWKKKLVREQETKLPPLSVDVDMSHYNTRLDMVPPQACSVPLILNLMLDQVEVLTEQPLPSLSQIPKEQKPASGPWLDPKLASYMLESFLPLIDTEDERNRLLNHMQTMVQKEEDKKKLRMTFGGANVKNKMSEHPLVIRHHNERALRLREVTVDDYFNPAEVEMSMMRFSPVWDLIQSVANRRDSTPCWKAVKQQLQHYCTDDMVSWSDVERLFNQSVFEAMTLTTLDQQGVSLNDLGILEPPQQQKLEVIPWDDPLSYAKQQLHKLQTEGSTFITEDPGDTQFSENVSLQLDLSEMQSCRLRSLFDWHYTEHHSAAVFSQVLMSASEEYHGLGTFRGIDNNILYIFCHNPMNSHRQSKESWDVALHTDVKFRNYLEHVAKNISDWTREEELRREAELIRSQSQAESSNEENASCSIVEEKPLEPFIRKDSLKYWKLEQDRLKEEETMKRSKEESSAKAKQQKGGVTDKKESKSVSGGKQSKVETTDTSTKVPIKPSITAAPTEMTSKDLHLTEEPLQRFTGYSMNGQLIHVSGFTQHLYPSDGGVITVEKTSFAEGSTLVKVEVKKDGHNFKTHIHTQDVVDLSKPPSQPQDRKNVPPKEDSREMKPVVKKTVKQGSFTAVLHSKIHLSYSFYGPTGEITVNSEERKEENPKYSFRKPMESSQGCEDQSAFPPRPFNSLTFSLPTGLLLKFLREDTQGVSPEEQGVLVKQSFLYIKGQAQHSQDASLSKELHRIITGQGAVIRCMTDGSTEVLFANGSVSFSKDSGPVWVPDAEADKKKKDETSETQKGCWQSTSPSGDRICTIGTTHQYLPTTPLLSFKATDPITRQVMVTREDLVVLVQNPDGSLIVQHADGTRITSSLQDSPPNGEKTESTRESEKGGVSIKEQVVLVERNGCASVVMYPERHTAHILLADGTVITGNNRAEYKVFPPNVGAMQIQSDGKCIYSSDVAAKVCNSSIQSGIYKMSHVENMACVVADEDGNLFQVFEDGEISVCLDPKSRPENDQALLIADSPSNRLLLVHEDGSGTELLSRHTVEELLNQAHSDPTIAVLKEPLPDKQDEFGITILKPIHQSVWAQWLLKKQNPDIIPPNLRNRTWHDFPREERKKPGPPFGTSAGIGLTLKERSSDAAAQHQHVTSCPEVLEIRKLYQHRPFTTSLKNTIDSRLKEYMESLMQREQRSEEMKVKDPHAEEIVHVGDLFSDILSFAEEEDSRISLDLASLYSQGVGASFQQSDVSEDTEMDADSLDGSQQSTDKTVSRWPERLAEHRKELSEEKTYREALRKKTIVPYFHPENFALHQGLLHDEKPNTRSPSLNLPVKSETDVKCASQESTPCALIPPPLPESNAAETVKMPENRPTNPRPQSPGESRRRRSSPKHFKSVELDVTGKPRQTKVRLPTSILSSKPFSEPNKHFLEVEEPVRRKCRTISLANPSAVVRGFQLLPSSVDFGTVQKGMTSTITVIMRNVGVDTCRFHVKQPPPATGLQVFYNPGPVAAGLHVQLHVQLFAMHDVQLDEAEPKTVIFHDIIIHTEPDILYLPVTAHILN